MALGFSIGPLIGGALSEKVSWRVSEKAYRTLQRLNILFSLQWCFWITLPVSAAAMAVVILVLPLKSVEGNFKSKLLVIDYMGVLLTLMGCTLLVLPLIWVRK